VIIDSHHHLWRIARGDYDWLTPDLVPLYRDFEPSDLAPLMSAGDVAGGIVVQAAPTLAETRFLLSLAARAPTILGVVGWADFADPDAARDIRALGASPLLKGVRPMLQDLDDDDFILRPPARAALAATVACGLRFDALVRPRHLPRLLAVRAAFPDLPIVIDHGGKPDIAGRAWEPWAGELARVAADGLTCCKLSGLLTEAGVDPTLERVRPYADYIIDTFGAARVMWGSDWPVLLGAADYARWLDMTHALLAARPAPDRAAILGGTAARFYGLSNETGETS
jgi:L-fuconolactonase